MIRRRRDFDTFKILLTVDVIVGNRGGWQATISLAKGKLSFAFINHGDRAFKDIEHRKIGHMTVYNGGAESGFPLTLPRTLRTAA